MSALLLHIQDTQVALFEGATLLASSPGVAVLASDGAVFGNSAMAQLRLRPRWVQSRFWQDISEDERVGESGERWSQADLASEHISQLAREADARDSDVVVALSGHYNGDALALLLGVIKSSGLKPVGLIDAALLECAHLSDKSPTVHLDIHLNQAIITRLSSGATLKRSHIDIHPDLGWAQILDNWSEWFARRFVEETRFDPHHAPDAEQKLLDQLLKQSHPASLESQKITLEAGSKSFALDVPAGAWDEAGQSTFERLAAALSGAGTVALSAAAGTIPGLPTALSNTVSVVQLPANALSQSFERHRGTLITGEDRLSVMAELVLASPEVSLVRPATHLLIDGHAWPIGDGLSLRDSNGDVAVVPYDGTGIRIWRQAQTATVDPGTEGAVEINGKRLRAAQTIEPGMTLTLAGSKGRVLAIHELKHGA